MPFEKDTAKQRELENIFASHSNAEQVDNIEMDHMERSVRSIKQEQNMIDRFLGMSVTEKSMYMTEPQEYMLGAIQGRNKSQLMLESEKLAGDSREMRAVKENLKVLETAMSPLNRLGSDRESLLRSTDAVVDAYNKALDVCRHYITVKNPKFYSSRKKMVEDTFARLTEEKKDILVARGLIETGRHDKYAAQQVVLRTPMDLLVLGQMEHAAGIDEVEEMRTEVASGAHLLSFDDFLALAGEKNKGVVYCEKGRLSISGDSRFANLWLIQSLKILFGGDEKATIANQQMKSRLYEIARQKLGNNHPYLNYIREKLEIGGLKSTSVDRDDLVDVLSGIVRWSSASLEIFDRINFGDDSDSTENNTKNILGVRSLGLFGAGNVTENSSHEVTKSIRNEVVKRLKEIRDAAKSSGILLPKISDRQYHIMATFPTRLADIAYNAQLDIMKQVHVLSGSREETRWMAPELSKAQQGQLQALTLNVHVARTDEQKQLAQKAMQDFVMQTAFQLAESKAVMAAQKKTDNPGTGEVYKQLVNTDIPLLNEGNDGLEQAIKSREGTKAFRKNHDKLSRGRKNLSELGSSMSRFSALRDKGLKDGLTAKECDELISAADSIDALMTKECMASMEFVAEELKGTRFKKGFEDFKKSAASGNGVSYKNVAVNLADRIRKAAEEQADKRSEEHVIQIEEEVQPEEHVIQLAEELQPVQQAVQPEEQYDGIRRIEITNGEALDRLEKVNKAGSRLFKVMLMQQQPCEYIKKAGKKERTEAPGEFWELRNVLTLMPKDRACIRTITISGQSFKLVQKQDGSLLVSLNGNTIALEMTAQSLAREIESDMMRNSSLYGNGILTGFTDGLSTTDASLGKRRYSRDMFVRYLASVCKKPETFFGNLDPVLVEVYARRILTAENRAAEKVIDFVINEVTTINSRYLLNNEETLTLVREMKEHRATEADNKRVVFNNAQIGANKVENGDNPAANDWTEAQKKVINLLADFIFPEDTWETDRINETIRDKVDRTVREYRAARKQDNVDEQVIESEVEQLKLSEQWLQSESGDRTRIALTLIRNADGLIEIIKDRNILKSVLDNLPPQIARLRDQIMSSIGEMLENDIIRQARIGLVPEEKQAKLSELTREYNAEEERIKAAEEEEDRAARLAFEETVRKENEEIDRYNEQIKEENRENEKINAARTEEFKVRLEAENQKIREYNASVEEYNNSIKNTQDLIEQEARKLFLEKTGEPYTGSYTQIFSWQAANFMANLKYIGDNKKIPARRPLRAEKTLNDKLEDGSELKLEVIKPEKDRIVDEFIPAHKTSLERTAARMNRKINFKTKYMMVEGVTEAVIRQKLLEKLSSNDEEVIDMLAEIQNSIKSMLEKEYADIMVDVQNEITASANEVFGDAHSVEQQQELQQEQQQELQQEQQQEQQQELHRDQQEEKLSAEDDSLCEAIAASARKARRGNLEYPQDIVGRAMEYLRLKKELEKCREIEAYRQKNTECDVKLNEIKQKISDYSRHAALNKGCHDRFVFAGRIKSVLERIINLGPAIDRLDEQTAALAALEEKAKGEVPLTEEEQNTKTALETGISQNRAAVKNAVQEFNPMYAEFMNVFRNNISKKEKDDNHKLFIAFLGNTVNGLVTIMSNDKKAAVVSDIRKAHNACLAYATNCIAHFEGYMNRYPEYAVEGAFLEEKDFSKALNSIDKNLEASQKLITGEGIVAESEEEKNKKINENIGDMILDNMVKASLGGEEGQGKFIKTVLCNYFRMMNGKDGLNMLASAVRNLRPAAKLGNGSPDEKTDMANYLSGFLKGAGPLLQKLLQGLPTAGMPRELGMALRDMKENLAPIPADIAEAQMRGIAERSGGEITRIEIIKSLGAASVGQAFMCRVYGRDGNAGDEVVIKLLRPDVKNRLEREKEVLIACARMADGTENMDASVIGGMEATYRGVLARIEEEMDLTLEAGNVMTGAVYDVGYENIGAMKLYKNVKPTQNAMVLEVAEGETLQKYFDRTSDYISNTDPRETVRNILKELQTKHRAAQNSFTDYQNELTEELNAKYKNEHADKYNTLAERREKLLGLKKQNPDNKQNEKELAKVEKELKKFNDEMKKEVSAAVESNPSYLEATVKVKDTLLELRKEKNERIMAVARECTEKLENLQLRQKHIGQLATKWILEGIYNTGFYHGDLHAGNIMISDNRATLIDFGNATKLEEDQRDKVVRMMIAATIGEMKIFRHNFHELMHDTSEEKYQMVREQLGETLNKIFSLGDKTSAGKRILTALSEAQKLGLEIPSEIYNFSQSQQRLQNTLDEMNQYITDMRKKIDDLAEFIRGEDSEEINSLFERYRAITRHTPNSFMDIMAGILSTHLKTSVRQFGFGNTLSNILKLTDMS